MLNTLKTRNPEREWMDDPSADPRLLAKSLRFIRQINVLMGYSRASVTHIQRLTRDRPTSDPVTLLDVATGSADIPLAALRWAARRKRNLKIIAIDLHATTARAASREAGDRLRVVQANACHIPLADGSVDYAMTAMFLHHLDEEAVVEVLREMNRVARRGVIISDLIRSRRAYVWISLFTLLANPMVRHDARVSVQQAFTPAEITALCRRAGVDYVECHRHFGHRFVLSGAKRVIPTHGTPLANAIRPAVSPASGMSPTE